jgi:exopolysaccharide biosynthesis WecB/TagA/CpsF family protein
MVPFTTLPPGHFEDVGSPFDEHATRGTSFPTRAAMLAELSWIADPLCVLAAAWLTWWWWRAAAVVPPALPHAMQFGSAVTWFAALLSPFVLRDGRFGALASRGELRLVAGGHVLRFTILVAGIVLAGALSATLGRVPATSMLAWLAMAFAATLLTRWLVASGIHRLQHRGHLSEVVAIVGAGVVADRMVLELKQSRPHAMKMLGVFDDRSALLRAAGSAGTIEALLELGKTRHIDWIVIALPAHALPRIQAIVKRLKALSTPIALCPQHAGMESARHRLAFIGGRIAVIHLPQTPAANWHTRLSAAGQLGPRWIFTLLELVGHSASAGLQRIAPGAAPLRTSLTTQPAVAPCFTFDNYDIEQFVGIASRFGNERYGYVVTPNADHLIRLHDDTGFRATYAAAAFVLLDSRFVSHLLRATRGIRLPVCTGSDLTSRVFAELATPTDRVVLVGSNPAQAAELVCRYGLQNLAHFEPPMSFIRDPVAVEDCLQFIESRSPFRFCLLALGSPQQEIIAQALQTRGRARGLALCIGAAVNFLTGVERRAPRWVRRLGAEWLYRLAHDPRRLASRYLIRGPRVFAMLRRAEIDLRPAVAETTPVLVSVDEAHPGGNDPNQFAHRGTTRPISSKQKVPSSQPRPNRMSTWS